MSGDRRRRGEEGAERTEPAEGVERPGELGERAEPAHDEIGIAVGPDGDVRGLFDAPFTGTATGEHTADVAYAPERPGEQRRTAVLAWIAAETLARNAETGDGAPCEPLKRLIADEPLDPLPALDGVPLQARAAPRAAREPRALAPEREDTATQIESFEGRVARRGEARGDTLGGGAAGGSGAAGAAAPDGRAARAEAAVPEHTSPARDNGPVGPARSGIVLAIALVVAAAIALLATR